MPAIGRIVIPYEDKSEGRFFAPKNPMYTWKLDSSLETALAQNDSSRHSLNFGIALATVYGQSAF